MANGWDDSSSFVNCSSPGGAAEGDVGFVDASQVGSASGSFQNDGLLGDNSGHNSDAEHGFLRPEMHSKPLVGSVQMYERHLFLCYKNPESWPPQVEAAEFDRLPRLLAAALKARKKEIPRKTRLTICEGRDGTEASNGDVLIFPDMIRYKGLTHFDVDTFVEEVLVKDTDWLSGMPERLKGSHVFVCSHGSRDRRCGVCGPVLVRKFKEEIEIRGLKSHVSVSPCSHVGGHKYAGNVIIYGPNAEEEVTGHWYGYVTPDDVPVLIDQHIIKGDIVDRLWRGQMGLTEEEQKKAQYERLKPNGETILEKGDTEIGMEKGGKETGLGNANRETSNGIQNEVAVCCQGSSGNNCCQNFIMTDENVPGDVLDMKLTGKSIKEDVKSDHSFWSRKGWGGVSLWFETWEREDTFAALAVIGAVASVAVAYHFYRRSG